MYRDRLALAAQVQPQISALHYCGSKWLFAALYHFLTVTFVVLNLVIGALRTDFDIIVIVLEITGKDKDDMIVVINESWVLLTKIVTVWVLIRRTWRYLD